MTAIELISKLETILEKRDGEDLEVRLDVDFQMHYPVWSVAAFEKFTDDSEDVVILQSYESVQASIRYEPRLQMPERPELN